MNRWVLGAALWAGAMVLAPSEAAACSCVDLSLVPVTPVSAEATVFRGRVERIRRSDWSQRAVTFAVETVLQGRATVRQVVFTGVGGGDCGYPFEVGSHYVVVAFPGRSGKGLHTMICGLTRAATAPQPGQLAHLGPGYPPDPAPEEGIPRWMLLSAGIALGLATIAATDAGRGGTAAAVGIDQTVE